MNVSLLKHDQVSGPHWVLFRWLLSPLWLVSLVWQEEATAEMENKRELERGNLIMKGFFFLNVPPGAYRGDVKKWTFEGLDWIFKNVCRFIDCFIQMANKEPPTIRRSSTYTRFSYFVSTRDYTTTSPNQQLRPFIMGPDSLSALNKSSKQLNSQTFCGFQPKSSCIQSLQMWLLMHISRILCRQDINADIHSQPCFQCLSFRGYCHQPVQ